MTSYVVHIRENAYFPTDFGPDYARVLFFGHNDFLCISNKNKKLFCKLKAVSPAKTAVKTAI